MQIIPSKRAGYMLLCGGIIIFIIGLGIFSMNRYNAGRSLSIEKIQRQIEEQRELAQVHELIRRGLERKNVHVLPNPSKINLPRQDVDKFQDSFQAEVTHSGLTTISLLPDVKTLAVGSRNILYHATLKGEFANFRRLLIGLGALPYLERIDEITVKQNVDSMEFEVKIWIALAN